MHTLDVEKYASKDTTNANIPLVSFVADSEEQ